MTVATALAVSWKPLTNSKLSARARASPSRMADGRSIPRLASTCVPRIVVCRRSTRLGWSFDCHVTRPPIAAVPQPALIDAQAHARGVAGAHIYGAAVGDAGEGGGGVAGVPGPHLGGVDARGVGRIR